MILITRKAPFWGFCVIGADEGNRYSLSFNRSFNARLLFHSRETLHCKGLAAPPEPLVTLHPSGVRSPSK